MKTNYVLIDYENVQVKSLALLKGEQFRVRVFCEKHHHATCGKNVPLTDIDAVYDALVKRGYVNINGEKIIYELPVV